MKLVALAEVARPHGVRGELRLKVYNRDSDLLRQIPEITLELLNGKRSMVKLKTARWANDALLVTLEGCASREAADALRGAKLLADRSAFPVVEDGDEYYACDLEGLTVVDPDGVVGVVQEVVEYPTCDALLVAGPGGQIEIPMIDGVVQQVDLATGRIQVSSRAPFGDLSGAKKAAPEPSEGGTAGA